MKADLVSLRVRVAPIPRHTRPAPTPHGPPRRVVLVRTHADANERVVRVVAVELVDDEVTGILVAPGSADTVAPTWREHRSVPAAPGITLDPEILSIEQIGHRITRRCGTKGVALLAFDLCWSVGRLAVHVRAAKGGGVSVALAGGGWHHRTTGRWMDSDFRPRLRLDGRFASWIAPRRRRSKRARGGPIIDLQVLGAALGCNATSAEDLARSLGVTWPSEDQANLDLLLDEALALVACYRQLLADVAEVAPGLAPEDVWSAGSLATYSVRRAHVQAPLDATASLSAKATGACAAAFFGGETLAALVRVVGPMGFADLNGTYPSLFSLLGLTSHLAAHHFKERSVPVWEIEAFLGAPDLRDLLDDRITWARWATTYVRIEPHGESVPHHRQVGEAWRFVIGPVDFGGGALWVHVLDLVGGALKGSVPKVVQAFCIEAVGVSPDLVPTFLPSGRLVDLSTGDWGRAWLIERELARAIEDPLVAERREALAKGCGVSGCWGVLGRVDRLSQPRPVVVEETDPEGKAHTRRTYPTTAVCEAVGPTGALLSVETPTPQEPGPLTIWHVAAAVPAACRALIALATHDVEQVGGQVAAVMTDAIVVMGVDGEVLQELLGRFDPLLRPTGGPAWKQEAGSLTTPTIGLVAGVGKVLLGRKDGGALQLVRSSDTLAGGHFLDPSGTGAVLDDGRSAWMGALQERVLAHAVETGHVVVPGDLAAWADDRPAMRPHQAMSVDEVRQLRRRAGDQAIMVATTYVSVGDFGVRGPVCLGAGRDPGAWRTWTWRATGAACRVGIVSRDGEIIESSGDGPVFMVPTMRGVLAAWLSEYDATMEGVPGGLRRPVLVRSHPALLQLVGRDGQEYGASAEERDEPLLYATSAGIEVLIDQAAGLGTAALVDSGVPERTARRVVARKGQPAPGTIARVATALSGATPRTCEGPGCTRRLGGRRDQRFCTDACRKAASRLRAPQPHETTEAEPPLGPASNVPPAIPDADVAGALDLLAQVPGLPPGRLGLLMVQQSPKLPGAVAACLAAGASPEQLDELVRADGSLQGARSPIGALVRRLERLAPLLEEERAAHETNRRQAAVNQAQLLVAMVKEGSIPFEAAQAVIDASGLAPELKVLARQTLCEEVQSHANA